MSETVHLFNIKVFDAQSMGSTVTSESLNIQQAKGYAVQASWTGTSPVGTFEVQGSNDNVIFTSVTSSPIAISGNSGDFLLNVENAQYGFMRVKYNYTSGVGSLTVYVNAQTR